MAWEVAGAHIAAGGTYEELFYRPTVLTNLSTDNPVWSEETFGPVAPVMSFTTVDGAVTLANASNCGLSVGILGEVGLAMEVADRINSGKIQINEQTVSDEATSPFGGVGASGTGSRFGGAAARALERASTAAATGGGAL